MRPSKGSASGNEPGALLYFQVLIKDARLSHRLLQETVAWNIGVSKGTYSSWECGWHAPKCIDSPVVLALAGVLHIPLADLQASIQFFKNNRSIIKTGARWSEPCSMPGCEEGRQGQGLCSAHYSRLRRTGAPEGVRGEPRRPRRIGGHCSVPDCDRQYYGRGLCRMHYWRLTQTGKIGPAAPTKTPVKGRLCSVPECGRAHEARLLCKMHYQRWKRWGTTAGRRRRSQGRSPSPRA